MMKKIIQWLAKVFDAEIERVIYKEKIIYKPLTEYINGDLFIDGNLKINGKLQVKRDIICYKTNK